MSTIELTAENFDQTVGGDGIVLVDWWAEWCGPCKQFGPVFEAASVKHQDITFGKVDTDAQQQLAGAAQISSIPTLTLFRDGIALFHQAGALPPAALEEIIDKARELDMDDVRRQIAEAESNPAEVGLDDFAAAHAAGGYVLDVRAPDEFASGHIPGAVNVALDDLPQRAAELPQDQQIYVVCAVGARSAQAAEFLRAQGLDAVNVADGTNGWSGRGWPLEQ